MVTIAQNSDSRLSFVVRDEDDSVVTSATCTVTLINPDGEIVKNLEPTVYSSGRHELVIAKEWLQSAGVTKMGVYRVNILASYSGVQTQQSYYFEVR